MRFWRRTFFAAVFCSLSATSLFGRSALGADPWLMFDGGAGPGHGKQIVLVSGDEEYRSEEGLPQLAKILSQRHGFRCTVLFAINPKDGTIDPDYNANIPGLKSLQSADLMILQTRWRNLPNDQMKFFADYIESGRPIIGLRTATHAFNLPTSSPFAKYSWNTAISGWEGGFGRHVLGETWINHWGHHKYESTRAIFAPGAASSPILHGIRDGEIWCPTDVYQVRLPMLPDVKPLLLGEVLKGMKPTDPPLEGKKNNPMMPIAWLKPYTGTSGKTAQNFCTTMGAASDLENEALRRLLVNAAYWSVGLDVPERANVDLVGKFHPSFFGFEGFKKGVRPEDLKAD